eukprot:gene10045-18683_t
MIGMVKITLKKTLGLANLTVSELQEVLLDIEFCLNNRPLTYQTDQLDDEVLTPNHLVHGWRIKPIREEEIFSDEDKIPARKRLRDGIERGVTLKTTTRGRTYEIDRPVQNLYPLELRADSDEKRVQETRETGEVADARPKRKACEECDQSDSDAGRRKSNLTLIWGWCIVNCLREYHKIHHGGCNEITVRDIVLVKDENLTRNKWKLGKVLHIICGRDGIERGVTLKTTTRGRTYEIDRPVQNLYPLELRADSDEKRVQETRETGEVADARPKRKACEECDQSDSDAGRRKSNLTLIWGWCIVNW